MEKDDMLMLMAELKVSKILERYSADVILGAFIGMVAEEIHLDRQLPALGALCVIKNFVSTAIINEKKTGLLQSIFDKSKRLQS